VGPASTHGLIFPTKRDGSLRISEQEAKLLFFQHLTLDRKFFFSVETPTVETYRQKGMTPMSARVDLSLYESDRKPAAHVECKSHNCGLEDIRKDLEKLLREKRTGCWFHTLENANRNTIPVLLAKFTRAFSLLPEWVAGNQCSYLFAFFAVKRARLLYQWVRFSGDPSLNASTLSAAFCSDDGVEDGRILRRAANRYHRSRCDDGHEQCRKRQERSFSNLRSKARSGHLSASFRPWRKLQNPEIPLGHAWFRLEIGAGSRLSHV
jgi:hypothetical protein